MRSAFDGWLDRLLRLLRRLSPDRAGEWVDDLEAEQDALRRAGSTDLRSRLHLIRETLSLVLALIGDRARDRLRSDPDRDTTLMRNHLLDGLVLDIRHALRSIRRQPGTSTVLTLTVGVALGAAAAMFSVFDAAWVRPLPYADADRLVLLYSTYRDNPEGRNEIDPLMWRDAEGRPDAVRAVGTWTVGESAHLRGTGTPRRLAAPRASASLFRVLGVPPLLGRVFTQEDERTGGSDLVILSHALWQEAFGADPGVIGRRLELDDARVEVIGVMPSEFRMPAGADLWRPLSLDPEWFAEDRRGWEFLSAVARLAEAVDPETADARLDAAFAQATPDRAERLGQGFAVEPLRDRLVGDTGQALLLLGGAVALLLTLACVNVAAVLVARSETRRRDVALRRALGSGSLPLVRLALIETLLLAGTWGALGLLLARGAQRWIHGLELDVFARTGPPGIDPGVVLFTLAVVGAVAVLFAVGPALGAVRTPAGHVLRSGGRGPGVSRGVVRTRAALVVGEVALALVLTMGATVAARGFGQLAARDPGFEADGRVAAALELPVEVEDPEARLLLWEGLLEQVRSGPGFEDAALVYGLPLEGTVWSASFDLVNDPGVGTTDGPPPGANMRAASPSYFETMGIPVIEGRVFASSDRLDTPPVALVDETVARRYWPGRSPVGDRIELPVLSREPATVIGVVGDVRDQGLHLPGSGHVYFPVLQRPLRSMTVVARGRARSGEPLAALRSAITETDERIPVQRLMALDDWVTGSISAPRIGTLLLTGFGLAASVLAAVGIYGVLAWSVTRRTAEIGTRMALGAQPGAVVVLVVRQALGLWGFGVVLGVAGAGLGVGTMSRLVPGIDPLDPLAWAGALGLLAGVAIVATGVPALRAARLDPARALRAE